MVLAPDAPPDVSAAVHALLVAAALAASEWVAVGAYETAENGASANAVVAEMHPQLQAQRVDWAPTIPASHDVLETSGLGQAEFPRAAGVIAT